MAKPRCHAAIGALIFDSHGHFANGCQCHSAGTKGQSGQCSSRVVRPHGLAFVWTAGLAAPPSAFTARWAPLNRPRPPDDCCAADAMLSTTFAISLQSGTHPLRLLLADNAHTAMAPPPPQLPMSAD